MTASPLAFALIKRFEGLLLTSYRDIGGVWTVGYGTTHGAEPDQTITEAQADSMLRTEVQHVQAVLSGAVTVPVSQNQFDALCSWAYNVGCPAATNSTLLSLLNAGKPESAALEFPKWDRAAGRESAGLKARREAEMALFLLEPAIAA